MKYNDDGTHMNSVMYMGHTFIPYGNIIGKDGETRLHRLSWRTDTLTPLLSKADGYDYYEFNKATGAAADIYYCPETKLYYVPMGGGLCCIDFAETKKYIRVFAPEPYIDVDFDYDPDDPEEDLEP